MAKNKITLNRIYNSDGVAGLDRIPDDSIDLLLTDPPYRISRKLNCKGQKLGRTAKLDFEYGKWDEKNESVDHIEWIDGALKKVRGWAIIFCAKQDISYYWKYFEKYDFKAIDVIVWQKPDPLPLNGKTKMLNAWEGAIIGKRDSAFFGGFCTHNIFKYQAPKGKNRMHPTQKPLGLFRELINLTTRKYDTVLDIFMGSGTTAVACTQLDRNFIGFETEKEYCVNARKRIKDEIIKADSTKITDYPLQIS